MNIGLFVCECGTNIASVVDVAAVAEHAKALDGVVVSEVGKWICSVDYLDKLKEFITDNQLDRVVVACCTPRTHESIFRSAVEEAGLNPNLLEFCTIREHVSWVHRDAPVEATAKARDLVEMAVAKARLLLPADAIRVPVGKRCMVVGGGVTGMTAAVALARHDFEVVLVEKSAGLGGRLNELGTLAPADRPAAEVLEPLIQEIENNKLITVKTETGVEAVRGYVGNFNVTLSSSGAEEYVDVSTIILATGMQVLDPKGSFGFGKYDNVITQLEFERRLAEGKLDDVNTVAIINCVNSRNSERGCCNIGCVTSMKHIKALRSKKPNSRVYLFYRDLIVPGTESEYCDEAQQEADALIRYAEGAQPEVSKAAGSELKVRAHDLLLEEDVEVNADLVVLVSPFCGDESAQKLKRLLRVTVGKDNFYQEAHVKLRPLDFASDGIYLAGCGRSPKSVSESISEALGTAMRAAIPMRRGYVESDGLVAEIDPDKCIGCELCEDSCAYGALDQYAVGGEQVDDIRLEGRIPMERPHSLTDGEGRPSYHKPHTTHLVTAARRPAGTPVGAKRFRVIEALCKGCGTCVGGCPEHAISMTNFTDEQIEAQIDALLIREQEAPETRDQAPCAVGERDMENADGPGPRTPGPEERPEPRTASPGEKKPVAFACHWCALGAADLAGVSRYQYPPDTRIIRVMCSGRVDPAFVLRAFAQGAPGVLVAGCEVPTCHYISGNIYANWRMELVRMLLRLGGLEPERLRVEWISAAQGDRFARIMREFSANTNELGPVPEEQLDSLDMRTALACADSARLRLLSGKLPELAKYGNEYGERLTRHELMRILDAAVKDEFIINKILMLLDRKSMSVKELALESDTAPPKVLRTVLGLLRDGRVELDRVDDNTPYYISIRPAPETISTTDVGPVKDNGGVPAARA